MQLKPWDAAMDLAKLRKVIRNLDQSIGDSQITALFKSLKNRSETVEVETLIQNFTGKPYETVEFRDKIFKVVYNEIYPNNEDKLIQMLSDKDVGNEGKVNQRQLFDVLNKIIKSVKSEDIERFVRFLETDSTGQVTYMEFISDL
jgi:Ca2+-binding EF-hand superfamily protein